MVVAGCVEGVGWVGRVDGQGVPSTDEEQEHEKLVEASHDRARRARQARTGGIVTCFAQALPAKASEDNGQANGQWPFTFHGSFRTNFLHEAGQTKTN